jgi:hypothetical protein
MDGAEKLQPDHRLIEMEERLLKKVLVRKENPLVILPSLAMKIGLREAIILQQIYYWLTKKAPAISSTVTLLLLENE